jgi:hypothetical protein
MTMDEFVALMEFKAPPAPQDQLEAFEVELGTTLPEDYRQFLVRTNGGVIRGRYRFKGLTPRGETQFAFIENVCGFRAEPHLSLRFNRACGSDRASGFPNELLWIMADPGGNGICLGLTGKHRGHLCLWIHDELPDPAEWDGTVETASNVLPLADSFTDFIAGVGPREASDSE